MRGATRDEKRVQQPGGDEKLYLGHRQSSPTFLGVLKDALPPEMPLEKPEGLIETRLTNDLGAALLEDLGSDRVKNKHEIRRASAWI